LAENSKVVLVQNGYPNPEILQAIGEKAVIMVVNAGFSLDASGTKAVTNRSQIDLPYGSLSREVSGEELRSVVGDLFLGNSPELSVRFDENIIEDVLKKTQYACIGAYCVVEAFKNSHPENEKFKFGKLSQLEATNSQIGINISDISAEVVEVAGFNLLSLQELRDRLKINENIESSIVADARSSSQMERGIVDNLLELGSQKNLSLPALNKLSQALQLIERTGWNLTEENIAEVKNLYAVSLETPSSVTENSVVQSLKNNGLQLTK
jgi:ketopantoate reductase